MMLTPLDRPHTDAATEANMQLMDEYIAIAGMEPTDALTVSNFSKAVFGAVVLFMVIGCVFAVMG